MLYYLIQKYIFRGLGITRYNYIIFGYSCIYSACIMNVIIITFTNNSKIICNCANYSLLNYLATSLFHMTSTEMIYFIVFIIIYFFQINMITNRFESYWLY